MALGVGGVWEAAHRGGSPLGQEGFQPHFELGFLAQVEAIDLVKRECFRGMSRCL